MAASARFSTKKKAFKTVRFTQRQSMEIVQKIKTELAKSGLDSYFISKRVEDLLARVYFPSIN